MFCDICIQAQNSNSFVTGCNVLKNGICDKARKNQRYNSYLIAGILIHYVPVL